MIQKSKSRAKSHDGLVLMTQVNSVVVVKAQFVTTKYSEKGSGWMWRDIIWHKIQLKIHFWQLFKLREMWVANRRLLPQQFSQIWIFLTN